MTPRLMIAIGIAAFAGTAGADYDERRELTLPGDGVERFVVHCGAGSLHVEGVEGLENIEVTASISLRGVGRSDAPQAFDHYVDFDLERTGSIATLTARVDSGSDGWWIFRGPGPHSGTIDLNVRVPQMMHVDVDDGSGETTLANIHGEISVEDGSGAMDLRDLSGNVFVDDGSGGVDITNVNGHLIVEDGSGSITIVGVDGDVDVEDGSGDVRLQNIAGIVTIDDGSGDIYVDGVEQDVNLLEEGSGQTKLRNVAGTITRDR